MVDFLCILRGRSLCPPQPKVLLRCGPLAEGWYKIQAHPSAYDYLLGLHPRAPTLKMLTIRPSRPLEEDFSQDNPLLDLFAREGSLAVQNWTDCMLEKQIRVTPEQMIATCELLLVLSSCLEQWRSSQTTQISRLREVVRDLESVLCSFSKSDECTMGFVDEAVARMLLWVSHNKSSPSSAHPSSPSMMVPLHSVQLMDSLREKYILDSSATPSESLDPMDLDEDPDSQSSRSMLSASARVAGVVANHDHSSQLDAFRPAAFLLLQVHAGFAAQKSGTQPSVLSNLISIAPATLLTMKDTVSLLLLETAYLSVPDIEVFSQHLSEALLQGTEFDYCESAQYLLVGVLLSLVKRRDLNQTEVFSDVGRSLFLFVHGLIDRKMCYPSVLLAFAELLCELLKIRMDLVIDSSISSVRTILFKILQSSDVLIKFQLADHFSAVFQEFDHADHEEVFKDVLDHLPSDKSWLEGIAVRLYFLAHLGSRWPTLLRRSVYHLVETPASIPACASFAARCMSTIATALHFDTAKELFRIFSPQLTYTWLRSQDLAELPYSIFGYPTLLELLKDGQEEITAQLFVAPDGDRVAEIADLLGEDKLSVLLRAFPLTAAYCISQDVTAMKPRSKDSSNLYMGRLRQLMGSENLHTLLLQHIPTILCIFFLRTDKPASFEEACNKVEALRLYAVNSAAIQLSLPADKHLPISQQPCFKAKILVGQILRLSEWAKIPFGEFWTASNCTSIVRSLLSVLQLPLGSLHACALITRIKMFIVIGGPRSSSGYHIQQLLHSLQPWINDLDCAPHAISLLRFLLERAREFLCTVPAFTTGVGLSLLLSLQEASLERDNPHSEHDHGSRDTVQNVAEFRYWLSSYLVGLEIPGEATETLTEIIADAASLLEVTAHQDEQDTNRLLFDLLEDDTRRISVLSGPVRSHLFEMLVTSHYDPGLFEHKTLQDDGSLARYLVPLWKIYCSGKGKAVFRSWVGKLLGKSFASNGNLPAELSREFVISSTDRQISPKPSQGFSSFKAITQSLLDLLFDPSRVTTGLAEETLSKMLRDLPRDTELMRFMSAEEPYVVEALGAGYILPEQTVPKTIFLEDLMAESSTSSALSKVEWIQSFCLYLIQKSDPAASIKCLASAVANSDSLASSFFPYLLHLALLNDLRLQTPLRNDISTVFRSFLTSIDSRLSSQCKTLLEAIMFLRNQARPGETTAADREDWLDINHLSAAQAALRSGMPKTALLLVEIDDSRERGPGRRTSRGSLASSHELLRDIYEQLDDPDSFYGISDESSLKAVMKRAEHEKDGMKLLSLRGAEYDHIIFSKDASLEPSKGIVGALDRLNLAGLSHSFSQHSFSQGAFTDLAESFYSTARKLERWDIGRPRESESEAADVFTLCQDLSSAHSSASIRRALSSGLLRPFDRIKESISHSAQLQSIMRNLAIAAEADELFSSQSGADLAKVLSQMATRTQWMHVGR